MSLLRRRDPNIPRIIRKAGGCKLYNFWVGNFPKVNLPFVMFWNMEETDAHIFGFKDREMCDVFIRALEEERDRCFPPMGERGCVRPS